MNKLPILLLFFLLFTRGISLAQEENYQPVQIIDTLESPAVTTNSPNKEKEQGKKKPEEAKTALEKRKENLKRLRFGGTFGLQFGSYTYVNLSPTIGYMAVKKRLEIGGGPIFIFERFKYYTLYAGSGSINFFVYGPDVYARGYIWKGLYLEAKYDLVNKTSYYDIYKKIWVNHLLLGGGYASPIGKVGYFYVSALFNVLNNSESIYQGTFGKFPLILNFGFGFGIGGSD